MGKQDDTATGENTAPEHADRELADHELADRELSDRELSDREMEEVAGGVDFAVIETPSTRRAAPRREWWRPATGWIEGS